MSNPLRTIEDYELFLYTLKEQYPSVRHSTVILTRRGAYLARGSGELQFDHGFRLIVRERILYHRLPESQFGVGKPVWCRVYTIGRSLRFHCARLKDSFGGTGSSAVTQNTRKFGNQLSVRELEK